MTVDRLGFCGVHILAGLRSWVIGSSIISLHTDAY
jgi:hypothetical protein